MPHTRAGSQNMPSNPANNRRVADAQRLQDQSAIAPELVESCYEFVEALRENLDDSSELRMTTRALKPYYAHILDNALAMIKIDPNTAKYQDQDHTARPHKLYDLDIFHGFPGNVIEKDLAICYSRAESACRFQAGCNILKGNEYLARNYERCDTLVHVKWGFTADISCLFLVFVMLRLALHRLEEAKAVAIAVGISVLLFVIFMVLA